MTVSATYKSNVGGCFPDQKRGHHRGIRMGAFKHEGTWKAIKGTNVPGVFLQGEPLSLDVDCGSLSA